MKTIKDIDAAIEKYKGLTLFLAGVRSTLHETAALGIKHYDRAEKLEAQLAEREKTSQYWKGEHLAANNLIEKLEADIRCMVEKAAAKHRPAYDEQSMKIMKLESQLAEAIAVIKTSDCYLDGSAQTTIGNNSFLHRQLKRILASIGEVET